MGSFAIKNLLSRGVVFGLTIFTFSSVSFSSTAMAIASAQESDFGWPGLDCFEVDSSLDCASEATALIEDENAEEFVVIYVPAGKGRSSPMCCIESG